ncbi:MULTISPECIES: hypothetical protein [unclassified Eikenella]|uniref:hypothetical protein n=1 Tax=unclassified Eikenella TaxID=2639367 RepID=UPI0008A4FBBD|nr:MULTISPECIES: hypothetical protein [unclassified Eikenella]OFK85210.1 hypothetical protein HMPREF2796_00725 [Eikenella sp. HMSC071B05]OFO43638.1 hypothetical protein HMPREF3043_10265 [Eikenella sp. HMSC073A11]
MTQQFKFGDRVRDKTLGLGECVVINASDDAVYVMNTRGDYNVVARPEHLELIPRPDTARLDWLADPANEIGKVILPGWCSDEYDSLRDAIDAAMQEQAAEAKE